MKLSAPSIAAFLASTVIIVMIVFSQYFGATFPVVNWLIKEYSFQMTLLAWAILFAGVAFNI
jgi:nicotinamide riboside kinase